MSATASLSNPFDYFQCLCRSFNTKVLDCTKPRNKTERKEVRDTQFNEGINQGNSFDIIFSRMSYSLKHKIEKYGNTYSNNVP